MVSESDFLALCDLIGIVQLTLRIEGGGWGDAVRPLVSPEGTAGEWFEDPYGEVGYTFSGPGKS